MSSPYWCHWPCLLALGIPEATIVPQNVTYVEKKNNNNNKTTRCTALPRRCHPSFPCCTAPWLTFPWAPFFLSPKYPLPHQCSLLAPPSLAPPSLMWPPPLGLQCSQPWIHRPHCPVAKKWQVYTEGLEWPNPDWLESSAGHGARHLSSPEDDSSGSVLGAICAIPEFSCEGSATTREDHPHLKRRCWLLLVFLSEPLSLPSWFCNLVL